MANEEVKRILYALHHSTFRNEKQIQGSTNCGCFYCRSIFPASEVTEWCDNDGRGDRTALCPRCGIDSVLGDDTSVKLTPELLELMNMMFFGDGIDDMDMGVNVTK